MLREGLVLGLALLPYWGLLPARARRPAFFLLGAALLAWRFPVTYPALGAVALAAFALLGPPPAGDAAPGWGRPRVVIALGLATLVASRSLGPEGGAALVGVSYFVFRLLHVAIERANGRATPAGLAAFLEFLLFPASLVSGPIERYADFAAGVRLERLALDDAVFGFRRIATGLAKKLLLVDVLARLAAPLTAAGAAPGAAVAWRALLGYSLLLYLDFSAYCDLALGVARLYGFRLSENFDWPYLSGDISEFWRRWHITLSGWLRDYLFLPLSGWLRAWPALRPRHLAVAMLSSLVTMVACGAWHGAGAGFLLWGLGHGLAIAAHHSWRERVLSRLKARRRRDLQRHPLYRAAATLLTFLVVTLLWLPFALPPGRALALLRVCLGLGAGA